MTRSFEAIGTHWSISIPYIRSEESLFASIHSIIESYDALYSRFREDSLVMRMYKQPGSYPLDPVGSELFQFYEKLYRATDGYVTPFIGTTLSQAGYDASYSFKKTQLTQLPRWEDALILKKSSLTLKTPCIIDIGAVGKGHLIDIVSRYIEQQGYDTYTVDAGGDMRIRSREPVRVGLEHPDDTTKVIGVISLTDKSICGSAGNRRVWGDYHHIINPKTLQKETRVLATWVIADTTMLADGLSTSLFFVEPEVLQQTYQFQYIVLYPDYTVSYSRDLDIELFT
jgi:FAD:protein FMN transferase